METVLKTTLVGLFFGTFGTTIGGFIGILFKSISNKFLSFILAFSSGLMLSIICFDLIPEAIKMSNMSSIILGIVIGIIGIIICDFYVQTIFNKKNIAFKDKNLLKTGIIVSIGLALHNIPEGLAIGAGFGSSLTLGLSLAIVICFHDIPEGISMAVPLKSGGMKRKRIILYVLMSGVATAIGAFMGALVGEISESIIGFCLSFAARCNAIYCIWRTYS